MSAMPASPRSVTRENYAATLSSLWALAMLLEEAPLESMLEWARRADAHGAILDPTLYREKSRALQEDTTMLEALLRVKETLAQMRRERPAPPVSAQGLPTA